MTFGIIDILTYIKNNSTPPLPLRIFHLPNLRHVHSTNLRTCSHLSAVGYRSTCSSDSVVVRNGDTRTTFLKRFCNNFRAPKIVYSIGNIVFLELRTSDALKNGGFKAEWDSKPIPKKGTLLPDIDTIYTHSYI